MPRCKLWLVPFFATIISGCGWFSGGEESDEFLDDIAGLETATEADVQPASANEERLELKLNVGDRFPLRKTVEQTLSQTTPQGEITSQSRLELLLAITVEEIREDRKQLGVRYHHIHYSQNVAGKKLVYDSRNPQYPVPLEVQAYHGLVNNGFSFWIGPDNKIIELVDFHSFLTRCVRDVPFEQRQSVITKLAETSGEEGIANFVDDSIGLLPYNVNENGGGTTVKVGDTWLRKRQIVRPIPLYLTSTCTLTALTDRYAEIDIVGDVTPSATYGPSDQPHNNVSITVRGGRSFGHCRIDRNSGLPINSRMELALDMVVKIANGTQFEQKKKIVTTIDMYPQHAVTTTAHSYQAGQQQPPVSQPPTQISNTSAGRGTR